MLPEKFKERMRCLLGDDYDKFALSLEDEAVRGVRINRLKISPEEYLNNCEHELEKIPYCEDGYILKSDIAVGASPEHHAGIFYMQDPGAMASLCAVDIPRGARVIDLCAAPGGKSGQAAAKIGDNGFLLSNEFVPKRAKITVGNFERLGIKNAVVTSSDTAEFKNLYSAFFDLVIADVPCSGEGMFRKNETAIREWSEENVQRCAARQREILENAAPLVKCGGYIIYSTCTFSIEENEAIVHSFLSRHTGFSLCEVKDELKRVTADGISYGGKDTEYLKKCRRFYPHISRGEGQFVALIRCDYTEKKSTILYKGKEKPLNKTERAAVECFLKETLREPTAAIPYKVGENIVLISHGVPIPQNSVFSAGVVLGEMRGSTLIPHHQFFTAYGSKFARTVELSGDTDRCRRYLRGEEIENDYAEGGWCALLFRGAAIGGGKIVGNRIKNHYPKGLRNP